MTMLQVGGAAAGVPKRHILQKAVQEIALNDTHTSAWLDHAARLGVSDMLWSMYSACVIGGCVAHPDIDQD